MKKLTKNDNSNKKSKKNSEKNSKKKKIAGRVFLIIAGALLLFLILRICSTEITAKKIPHHFASAEEGIS